MTLDFTKHDWHQHWEVEPGVRTPGDDSVADLLDAVDLPRDLTGKRVLDISGANGCFGFECERRGAAEVLAVNPEPAERTGHGLLREHLDSKVDQQLGLIYDLDPALIGRFDVVLCFGVIDRLRHPLLGLDNIRRVCYGELFLQTSVIDDSRDANGTSQPPDTSGVQPKQGFLLQFVRGTKDDAHPSVGFSPTMAALHDMVESAGFDVLHAGSSGSRGWLRARPAPASVDGAQSTMVQPNTQGAVSEAEVQVAFRLLLERDAEPGAVAHFTSLPGLKEVRQQIMGSAEFVRCLVGPDIHVNPYLNFHHIHTVRMTARRQEHLASLPLDLRDKSVIEIGAGIGLHGTFFLDRDCHVHSTDGRQANVDVMQALFDEYGWYQKRPNLTIGRLDIESNEMPPDTRYDVVYCYGLLYHVADPALVIKNLRALSRELLLIETSVSVGDRSDLVVGTEDPDNVSQSVHGGGSHPTRDWIVAELAKHFPHVGLPVTQPNHEFFPIDWSNPERFADQTMRCVFVASDHPLSSDAFSSKPQMAQMRMA